MSDKIKLYRYISVLYMDEPMDGKTYYYKTNKYDLYNSFTNMAINPSGNLNSYTEKYNTLDSDIVDQYNKVKEYIE